MHHSLRSINRRLDKILNKTEHLQTILQAQTNPELEIEREKYKFSFKQFVIDFWAYAGTSGKLFPGIAIDALSQVSTSLLADEFSTLLVTMPSREGKSTLTGVLLPAWIWTLFPNIRFLTVSYAHNYAVRDNLYFQQVINSPLYQKLWGHLFHLTIETRERTYNSCAGQRIATSLGGRNTGEGGDILIFDDLNNLTDMSSKVRYSNTNFIIDTALLTRFNNPSKGKLICIQHRSSPQDAIGHFLSKKDARTVLLSLPAEYEKKTHCKIISPTTGKIIYSDPRTEEGQLLSPERYANGGLERIKRSMGTWAYNTIYQCNPVPAEGKIFNKEWFKVWTKPHFPAIQFILQAWDTALSTSADACFSACTNWGVFQDDDKNMCMILLSSWAGKLEWNDLQNFIIRMNRNIFDNIFDMPKPGSSRPHMTIIEAKANGISLLQSLKHVGVNAYPYNPKSFKHTAVSTDAKTIRARLVSPLVENGRIFLRGKAPSFTTLTYDSDQFLTAATTFPTDEGATRDLIDTFTMSVDWLQQKKWLKTMEEDMDEAYDIINSIREADRGFDIKFT